jgi:hypothetical protein
LEKELESLRAERDSLQTTLDEYIGNTHEGTLLSTDTKYIAFENAMENVNVSFTEEQYSNALKELMTKNEVNLSNVDIDDPRLDLSVKVYDNIKGLKINIYKNNVSVGSAVYNQEFHKNIDAFDEDEFKFECVGMTSQNPKTLYLEYTPIDNRFDNAINISNPFEIIDTNEIGVITGKINYKNIVDVVGNIGTLKCYIK